MEKSSKRQQLKSRRAKTQTTAARPRVFGGQKAGGKTQLKAESKGMSPCCFPPTARGDEQDVCSPLKSDTLNLVSFA